MGALEQIYEKLTAIEKGLAQVNAKLEADNPTADEIGDVKKCAEWTGYKVRTIYNMVNREQIPVFGRVHGLRFSKRDIFKWMRERHRS